MHKSFYATLVLVLAIMLIAGAFFAGILYRSQTHATTEQVVKEVPNQPIVEPTIRPLDAEQLWSLVNNWRTSEGLREYQKNELLCDIARSRIYQIRDDWSHDGFVPTVNRVFGNRYRDIGENLATDMITEGDALTGWLWSSTHKENLLKNYRYSCIATDGRFAVQIFGNF